MLDKHSPSKHRKRAAAAVSATASFPSLTESSSKKLAPRSSLQFKVGPQFVDTISDVTIIDSKGKVVQPVLTPRIDRGFERIDNEWVGYKRNYFTLVCTFFFKNLSFNNFAKERFFAVDSKTGATTRVKYFGLRLASKCADDNTPVSLIQHTAKRDRGPQFEPPIHPAIPSDLPNHDIIREAANVRNTSKIAKLNKVFFFDRDLYKTNNLIDLSGLKGYPTDKIIKVARYERIQFSSSINYKKPSLNNKRFKLSVELVGFVDKGDYITLAHTETPSLIVRGRSPSNYNHITGSLHSTSSQSGISKSLQPHNSLLVPLQTQKYNTCDVTSETVDYQTAPTLSPHLPSAYGSQSEDKKKRRKKLKVNKQEENYDTFFNDLETYQILSNANKEMDELGKDLLSPHLKTPKKKRGRKPKSKTEAKEKYIKKVVDPSKKIEKPPKEKKVANRAPSRKSETRTPKSGM